MSFGIFFMAFGIFLMSFGIFLMSFGIFFPDAPRRIWQPCLVAHLASISRTDIFGEIPKL
jgi:hypothetical protein